MTCQLYHCVAGSVTSSDTALLDAIEDALPSADDVRLGSEMSVTRTENDDGTEPLSARMTFARGEVELPDGTVTDGATEADKLFQAVVSHDLAGKADAWTVQHYRTPEGAVTAADVRAWYESNPAEQPTDEDGESYVPSQWDPTRHIISKDSG